jgi:hypothetical protein
MVAKDAAWVGTALVLAGLILGGCSAKPDAGSSTPDEFRKLVTLYSRMVMGAAPPANEAEFKKAIGTSLKSVADVLQVSDVDALFVSSRDGKPFVVVYGSRPAKMNPDVVAYEQDGVDGKRLVGFSLGTIEEVDEARFKELVPAGATPP